MLFLAIKNRRSDYIKVQMILISKDILSVRTIRPFFTNAKFLPPKVLRLNSLFYVIWSDITDHLFQPQSVPLGAAIWDGISLIHYIHEI